MDDPRAVRLVPVACRFAGGAVGGGACSFISGRKAMACVKEKHKSLN